MTGFIRGLFGGKAKNPGESDRPVQPTQPTIERAGEAFYLDPDDAKSYGDIEFMRSAKTVRRTFAKKRGETEEKESIRQISSMQALRVELQENGLTAQKFDNIQGSSASMVKKDNNSDRRRTDTNLDMFRQMAKDIKK
ncbi:hypothetical protein [Nodosilinea sp. P-1105]|uniref:hypothetical protein n=1 Tax=Nodosilinea sp. P-1105 TaxID=2546229 RepID=UPI00197E489E|nr:hypothetical protein [Nodosilinea sp. P-1105]